MKDEAFGNHCTVLALHQFEADIVTSSVLQTDALLNHVLSDVLRSLVNQLNISSAGLWLYDAMIGTTLLYLDYEDHQIRLGEAILRPGALQHNPLSQWDQEYMPLLRQKQVLVQTVQDVAPRSPQYLPVRRHNRQRGIRTIMVIPLFFKNCFLGNVTLRNLETFQFSSDQMNLALALANQAAIALQFTQSIQQPQSVIAPQVPKSLTTRSYAIAVAGLTTRELNQVTNYIDHHLAQGVKLAELAQVVAMSPSHFARLFKQSTGYTPHQYVMQCRLETAKWLLTTQPASIELASNELGFANPGQFATFFRKQTGMSPSVYRRNCNSTAI